MNRRALPEHRKPGFNVLWDGTAIRELLMEKDDMLEFVQIQRDFGDIAGSGRDVIVTTRPLDKVMAGMYAAMMKHEDGACVPIHV
jgi:hypothetical protein